MHPRLFTLFFKLFAILSLIICSGNNLMNARTYTLNYDMNDFKLLVDTTNNSILTTYQHPYSYSDNEEDAAIPWIEVKIAIPNDSIISNLSYSSTKSLFASNIKIASIPITITTSHEITPIGNRGIDPSLFSGSKIPYENVKITSITDNGSFRMANLLVCPFEYYPNSEKLYFTNQLQLYFTFSPTTSSNNNLSTAYSTLFSSTQHKICLNSDDIVVQSSKYNSNTIDYLIITSELLKPSFSKLLIWKQMKGLTCAIATTEEINKLYSGSKLHLKIKSYLRDIYTSSGIKYVMVGGDDIIVPSVPCYGNVTNPSTVDSNIPCDLFYSCLNGQFDWDTNKNGIIGEVDDNINFSPSFNLTRLPVRTNEEVDNYCQNVIDYETNPTKGLILDKHLFTGAELSFDSQPDSSGRIRSVAEMHGELFFKEYIQKYWHGSHNQLYDTYIDCTDADSDYPYASTLQKQFNKGYPFINVFTHGMPDYWDYQIDEYTTEDASALQNQGYTFITTIACHTNAFDSSPLPKYNKYKTHEPSLSESFIRNRSARILGYLGCSREGFTSSSGLVLGASEHLNGSFYKILFENPNISSPFGNLVAEAKLNYIGSATTNNPYRWLMLGLNPIGDPELPVFRDRPIRIENISINCNSNSVELNINDTNVNATLLSFPNTRTTDIMNYGLTNSITIPLSTESSILTLYKEGAVPIIIPIINGTMYLQNIHLNSTSSFSAESINIGNNVTNLAPTGDVKLLGGTLTLTANQLKWEDGFNISSGATLNTYHR